MTEPPSWEPGALPLRAFARAGLAGLTLWPLPCGTFSLLSCGQHWAPCSSRLAVIVERLTLTLGYRRHAQWGAAEALLLPHGVCPQRNERPAIGSMWQANAFSTQNVLDLRMACALMLVAPLIYKYWCEPGWEAEPTRPRFLLSRGFAVQWGVGLARGAGAVWRWPAQDSLSGVSVTRTWWPQGRRGKDVPSGVHVSFQGCGRHSTEPESRSLTWVCVFVATIHSKCCTRAKAAPAAVGTGGHETRGVLDWAVTMGMEGADQSRQDSGGVALVEGPC